MLPKKWIYFYHVRRLNEAYAILCNPSSCLCLNIFNADTDLTWFICSVWPDPSSLWCDCVVFIHSSNLLPHIGNTFPLIYTIIVVPVLWCYFMRYCWERHVTCYCSLIWTGKKALLIVLLSSNLFLKIFLLPSPMVFPGCIANTVVKSRDWSSC